jgi:hypothetical protein
MPRIFLAAAVVLTILAAGPARAQEPSGPAPWQWTLAPQPKLVPPLLLLGEPTGSAGLSPWALSTPLRLSLQSGIFPIGGAFPNCQSRQEASGNTVNGFALQRYAPLQLAPGLVLHGFSSAGCPVDGAIGGALTYSVPLRPSLQLVAGAGVYGVPAHYPLPARTRSDFRVDVMKQLDGGRSLSVGVGKRGVSFGGVW